MMLEDKLEDKLAENYVMAIFLKKFLSLKSKNKKLKNKKVDKLMKIFQKNNQKSLKKYIFDLERAKIGFTCDEIIEAQDELINNLSK